MTKASTIKQPDSKEPEATSRAKASILALKTLKAPVPPFLEEEGFSGPHKHIEKFKEDLDFPDEIDHKLRAEIAKITGGMSPATVTLAYMDWLLHLASMPGRQQHLAQDAAEKTLNFLRYCQHKAMSKDCSDCIEVEDHDHRFKDKSWQKLPFKAYAQGFLLTQHWWQTATSNVWGVSKHHEDVVKFTTRQWLDMLAPSNYPWINPLVINKTIESQGRNFILGGQNLLEDTQRIMTQKLPRGTEPFKIGENLATSKGKVVFRNNLIELIQYEPQTAKVHPEPVLMIPAWIMKYYILDLSERNSMVNYLTSQGHTVFMISWKNPDEKDANLGMDDYLKLGAMAAFDAVSAIIPGKKIHAMGYCLGGTLLAIAAAAMAGQKDERIKTISLFTAQVDFEEAGELLLLIDESQLALLEDLMRDQGYLRKEQVSGSFNMLRSKDLIWSKIVEHYLKGVDNDLSDLMAWNKDATRLPARMHSDYLRRLYLNNDLAENHYKVDDKTISLGDIMAPVFSVATRTDHIAPWKSVYKTHDFINSDLTFLLTSGGHNAGIISEPGHEGRKYQVHKRLPGSPYMSPDNWRKKTKELDGSWWPEWQKWLKSQSGTKVNPPKMGAAGKDYKVLEDAPGSYVHML